MRSLLLAAFYIFLLASGASAAFVFALGYIWVDLFSPQQVAYSLITSVPLSLIVGMATFASYILTDRRSPPHLILGIQLLLLWAFWITLTTLWAEVPDPAWIKWNWAIKTVLFAAFLPFVIRSRIQIEAMILTIVLSLSGTIICGGITTLLTGGGYHITTGLIRGNSGFAEGSTLSASAIAIIPLILYARRHTAILPRHPLVDWFCCGFVFACILTTLGTYERTGLVCMAVLGVYLWLRSRHKIVFGALGTLAVLIGVAMVSGDWANRMATISNFHAEDSALGRIAVWLWTLDYVKSHPLGGGFAVYLIDHFTVPIAGTSEFLEIKGKAFHSVYFEVLGEQGIIGFAIFVLLIATLFGYLRSVRRAAPDLRGEEWLRELSLALTASAAIYLIGGAFVGIAFQPLFYYWCACAISLHQYVARVRAPVPSLVGARQPKGRLGPLKPV